MRFALLAAIPLALFGQAPASERILTPYGISHFSPHYRESVDAFFESEAAYRNGDYAHAGSILDAFWKRHPAGTAEWDNAYDEAIAVGQSTGANFGAPVCYYALRSLTECVAWRRQAGAHPPDAIHVRLTVLLVGKSHGIQPGTAEELRAHTGRNVTHTINPLLAANDGAIVHQSLWLFEEYVQAITVGKLHVDTVIVPLPNVDVAMDVRANPELTAELSPGSLDAIWRATSDSVKAATDWWCVFYPAHAPEPSTEFPRSKFGGGGGMTVGPDRRSPAFMNDDLWLVRPPPHLGKGAYTEEERRAYLPQWFQHEFFHHLYARYPEFRLESITDHQWFDLKNWPKDFEGKIEPDYYAESVHKRLQPLGNPPLHLKLLYRPPPPEVVAELTATSVAGEYRHDPVENPWHEGTIAADPLRWTNRASVSWSLKLGPGARLPIGTDYRYYREIPATGRAFELVLRRGGDGGYLPEVEGFWFEGGFYKRVK